MKQMYLESDEDSEDHGESIYNLCPVSFLFVTNLVTNQVLHLDVICTELFQLLYVIFSATISFS